MKARLKTKEQLKQDGFKNNGAAWYPASENSFDRSIKIPAYDVAMYAGKAFDVYQIDKTSGAITIITEGGNKTYPFVLFTNGKFVVERFKAPTDSIEKFELRMGKEIQTVHRLRNGEIRFFNEYKNSQEISKSEARRLAKFLLK